ncbi:hypothetical protein ACKFKG_18610 [Phormidesmis sp. 146-35]
MLKIFLGVSAIAAVALLPFQASAKQPDYDCYMQTNSKQIIDLTRSVCGFNAEKASKAVKQDAAYLADIRKMMKGQADPTLIAMVETNPSLFLEAATTYCEARQSGISEGQFMERQYMQAYESLEAYSPAGANRQEYEQSQQQFQLKLVSLSIATSLAPKHYCPQVASRSIR